MVAATEVLGCCNLLVAEAVAWGPSRTQKFALEDDSGAGALNRGSIEMSAEWRPLLYDLPEDADEGLATTQGVVSVGIYGASGVPLLTSGEGTRFWVAGRCSQSMEGCRLEPLTTARVKLLKDQQAAKAASGALGASPAGADDARRRALLASYELDPEDLAFILDDAETSRQQAKPRGQGGATGDLKWNHSFNFPVRSVRSCVVTLELWRRDARGEETKLGSFSIAGSEVLESAAQSVLASRTSDGSMSEDSDDEAPGDCFLEGGCSLSKPLSKEVQLAGTNVKLKLRLRLMFLGSATKMMGKEQTTRTFARTRTAELEKKFGASMSRQKTDAVSNQRTIVSMDNFSEYFVQLQRREGAKLGIDLSMNSNSLTVTVVSLGGLVYAWNESHADCRVQRGDRIVEVNGVSGDPAQMDEQLVKASDLRIKLLRNPQNEERSDDDDAGDASRAGLGSWLPQAAVFNGLQGAGAALQGWLATDSAAWGGMTESLKQADPAASSAMSERQSELQAVQQPSAGRAASPRPGGPSHVRSMQEPQAAAARGYRSAASAGGVGGRLRGPTQRSTRIRAPSSSSGSSSGSSLKVDRPLAKE
eukprot:TRINITY_DN59581_c0_g1_i1.p1 TRINITY_DN59581_c0_g1~~TRINITY_DN59581_c0_g1_i1.p1  ORF type:complete len:649 (+),score=165.83 TRINITY_DN59581_c0_g1_i1:179-1948(+)